MGAAPIALISQRLKVCASAETSLGAADTSVCATVRSVFQVCTKTGARWPSRTERGKLGCWMMNPRLRGTARDTMVQRNRIVPDSRQPRILMCSRLFTSLTLCIIVGSPAFAWWETGHQTVARVAAGHLSPKARARVAAILGVPDSTPSVADAMAKASTWADEVKAATQTGEWHYIDLTLQDKKTDIDKRCLKQDCVTARIRSFSQQLAKKGTDPKWTDLDVLRFVIHFVGDVHQPLHAISDADLGGNCERLDPPIDTARNLHALWDGGMLTEIEKDDKVLAANLQSYLDRLGPRIQSKWAKGDERDWAWESHELAQRVIYQRLHIPLEPEVFPAGCQAAPAEIMNFKPVIDSLYINDMKPVLRDQLSKGGLRLAAVLNRTLR